MRLEPGVIRELHWHKEAEWAYVLSGELAAKQKNAQWWLTPQR
jgi:oxalate decarboxylase